MFVTYPADGGLPTPRASWRTLEHVPTQKKCEQNLATQKKIGKLKTNVDEDDEVKDNEEETQINSTSDPAKEEKPLDANDVKI